MSRVIVAQPLYCPPERPRPLRVDVEHVTTSVQLCLSPHCSTLASLIEGAPTSRWPRPEARGGWAQVVPERAKGIDLGDLGPYTCGRSLAPFLTAVLRDPAPTFEDQLREIESVDPAIVARWIAQTYGSDVPEEYQPFTHDPAAALRRMSQTLQRYFDLVVAPLWPTIREFLDREVVRVGYLLATQPAAVVLGSLHPSMRIEGEALVIDSPQGPLSGTLVDRRLKLTPLISTGNAILVDFNGDDEIKVGYAAPGVEELWARHHDDVADDPHDLVDLLGSTRATILRSLESPDTTTTLAQRLGISPATTSAHLAALSALSLLERHRAGKRVYYSRSERGNELLRLFGERHLTVAEL